METAQEPGFQEQTKLNSGAGQLASGSATPKDGLVIYGWNKHTCSRV